MGPDNPLPSTFENGDVKGVPRQKIRETVARELDKFPDEELKKLLDYIRFLKLKSLPDDEIGARFSSALASARQIARQEGITESEIQEEVEASRSEK